MGALIVPPAPAGAATTPPRHLPAPMQAPTPYSAMGPLTADSIPAFLTLSTGQGTRHSEGYNVGTSISGSNPILTVATFIDTAIQVDTSPGGGTVRGGLWQDSTGLHWFAYSDTADIVCIRGTVTFNNFGCLGSIGDLGVAFNHNTYVQIWNILPGGATWYVYVGDDKNTATEVASIVPPNATNGAFGVRMVAEEQYLGTPDPGQAFGAALSHPQYENSNATFVDWPASGTGFGNNFLLADTGVCPLPYAAFRSSDPRTWWVGDFAVPPSRCEYNPLF